MMDTLLTDIVACRAGSDMTQLSTLMLTTRKTLTADLHTRMRLRLNTIYIFPYKNIRELSRFLTLQ